jgi:murein DD-endopeptidase MepM/ murein hydrolase activator NlpD
MSQPPIGGSQEPVAGASKLLGTTHLQSSIDSLKSTIDHLNQGLSGLVPQLQQMNRMTRAGGMGSGAGAFPTSGWWGNNGGQGPLGGGQQPPRNANGGGATFNGGQRPPGGGGQQQPPGQGGGGNQPPPSFGQRLMNTAGGKSGVAVAGGYALGSGINKMINAGAPGMYTADLIASQLSLGGVNSRQDVLNSMKGQVTGLSMGDVAQGRYTLSRGLGVKIGSAQDQRMQQATGVAGLINPGLGNAQIAQTAVSLNAPDVTNKLRGIGVDVGRGPGSNQDPLTLANQILQKIGNWQSINTSEKINFHLDDPNGAIETTLRNWEAHGYLPQGSRDVIKEEIRAILIARMNGMSFQDLQKAGGDANSANRSTRKAALDQLKKAGVNPTSIVGEQKELGAAKRDRDLGMTDSFAAGARNATDALTAFTDVINKLLNGPLGSAVGYYGGAKGVLSPGGGNGSDIGAMSNVAYGATGGQPNDSMGSSSQGTPLSTSSLGSGSNKASGAPGTASGSGKASAGKQTIKFARPVAGKITSPFGTRKDPLNGRTKTHTGIDFGVGTGTPIHASAAGTVVFSGSRGANYWAGNHVIIDHGGGYQTLYAHQSRVKARVGARVQQGEVIGFSGATGRVTGPHLHFEIHINGHPVDPAPYLSGAGVAISDSTVTPSAQGTSTAGSSSSSATSDAAGMSGAAGSIITSERAALAAFAGAGSMGSGAAPMDTSANTSSSSSNNASSGTSGTNVPSAPSSVSGNQAIVKQMAAAKGWTGKQWDALYQLVMHESGFKNTAQNPTSTAFGLFQFLNGTWSGYGVKKTSDPRGQTQAGLAYIADRYGNPANAWSKWQARSPHWYDSGAWEMPRDEQIVAHQGEMIIRAKEARQIREVLLNGSAYGATSKPGAQTAGAGLQITIEQGAITISTNAGVTSTGVNDLGKAIADQLAQNEKIKKLTQGVLT